MSGPKAREIAARTLTHRPPGAYIEDLLERALAETTLAANDRGLCQELVYGVVRWQATLDWLIRRKTPGRTQKEGLQVLLRLGLYQIFWLNRIPDHAAVNETVTLARLFGFGPQAGFVNAVLRGFLREKEATAAALSELRRDDLATGFSHPSWLVDRWIARFGRDHTVRLLEWNNTPPTTFARVNTLKGSAEQLLQQWREEEVGYDFLRKDWFEENLVFKINAHPPVHRWNSFQQGKFYLQDPSTLLAIETLDPKPGLHYLDTCAAPGGKLTYLAQRIANDGRLVALDPDPARLKRLAENCRRLGVDRVTMTLNLEGLQGTAKTGGFDRVLVDAPCSNSGVMRRRVDLRWRIRPEEIEALRNTQLALLHETAPHVKLGGWLVYSTCSLEPEENSDLVRQFLGDSPEYRLDTERQLSPVKDEVDGAYVARLVRTR